MWTQLQAGSGRRLLWCAFIASIAGLASGAGIAGESGAARDITREHREELTSRSGDMWAILIGLDKYSDKEIKELDFCVNDVKRMFETLVKGGYPRDRILVMHTDLPVPMVPTNDDIRRNVRELLERTRQGDTVLFFFSGHGFLDSEGQLYLATYDCSRKDLGTRGLRVDEVRNLLKNCRATRKLVFLDCCHSGSSKGDPDDNPSVPAASKKDIEEQMYSKGLVTIASCSPGELSYEWKAQRTGIFTYFLAEGLSGLADDEKENRNHANGDGIVDVGEIFEYLNQKVPTVSQREAKTQHPIYLRGDDVRGTPAVAFVSNPAHANLPVNRPLPVRSATAQFAVRDKNSGKPMADAGVELVYRADPNSQLEQLAQANTDRHGATSLDVKLTPMQESQGEFLVVVSLGKSFRQRQVLGQFPKTLQQDVEINGEFTNKIGMQLQWIPPGTFQMGLSDGEKSKPSRDSKPHEVEITRGFLLGKCEVTVGQFRQFVDDTGYKTWAEAGGKNGKVGGNYFDPTEQNDRTSPDYNWRTPGFEQGMDHPVVQVNYGDAVAFCKWLSEKDGGKYRLPTEAEWEYACRANRTAIYGETDRPEVLASIANVRDNDFGRRLGNRWLNDLYPAVDINDGFATTAPVGNYRPNAFGLYDMLGNVYEMCEDWYDDSYYSKSPRQDPPGPKSGDCRVSRGGSWFAGAIYSTCSRRRPGPPKEYSCDYHTGFRVAWEP